MLQVLRAARPILGAGLAAAWLLASGAPSRAAMMASGAAPGPRASAVMPAQAPRRRRRPMSKPTSPSSISGCRLRRRRNPLQALRQHHAAECANNVEAAPPANASAVEGLRLAIQYGQQEIDGMKRMLPAYRRSTPACRRPSGRSPTRYFARAPANNREAVFPAIPPPGRQPKDSRDADLSSAAQRFFVIDLTAHRAGPTAVRQLADWGAEVIKIEPPGEQVDATGSRRDGPDFRTCIATSGR